MSILILFAVMFTLMFLGAEIFLSMGIAAAVYLLVSGNAPLTLIATSMINGITNTSLLAIPFFILAGELMNVCPFFYWKVEGWSFLHLRNS